MLNLSHKELVVEILVVQNGIDRLDFPDSNKASGETRETCIHVLFSSVHEGVVIFREDSTVTCAYVRSE